MILTGTALRNIENIRVALDTSNAVLIQGEIGCGKSLAVEHLAEEYGAKGSMIQVNVDDTFDSKDLLGKFSATDTPGSFEWIPGPLTVAVEKGYWILMEDIDLASFDVFSVILSLLENSTLFISDKNRIVTAHPSFKLIATQQLYTSGDSLLSRKSSAVPYAELWGTVIMESLPSGEICEIVGETFPNVPVSVVKNLTTSSNNVLCSLRNVLRWSRRVSKRLPQSELSASNQSNNGNNFVSSTLREIMLTEAFDCFVAKFAPGNEQRNALQLISLACGVPDNVAEPIVLDNKPQQQMSSHAYSVGRVHLPIVSAVSGLGRDSRIAFAPTRNAMSLLERLAAAVESKEHVLLTGETGVGKTFIVQYLADQLGQDLIVHNLNQQTDTSDFMGGWKPLDIGISVREAYSSFIDLFSQCFNAEKNTQFLNALQLAVNSRKWELTLRQIQKGCQTFKTKNAKTPFDENVQCQWGLVETKAEELLDTVEKTKTSFSFFFEEGSLVKAWRQGHWILLDELNLATTEVLERVSSVLGDVSQLFLTDKPDALPIPRHPNFHVFANMNPPTDVGKKDLPPSLRSRFTEFYVCEPFNHSDIVVVVKEYIGFLTADARIEEITSFFLDCVANAKTKLCAVDGESKPPSYSLRTLTRALSYVRRATPLYGFLTALFDGLLLGFSTPLQRQFHAVVEQLIIKNIFKGKVPRSPTLPAAPADGKHVAYEHIWIPSGDVEPLKDEGFILTPSVKEHLKNLSRSVFANRPVLLEGPTSSGKSSMVKYLAELTGNTFVRINNHDSTEVQEYLGHYVTDEFGKLRFVDGILVNAVRHGYWVVLDELNLAPTDVLEALNRLLDDNCELFIPDTQETIKPHPQLRIFATQNPAGIYGGRKMLSRAFRNRFLEITVDEIPNEEISTIICQRYSIPVSFAEKMVEVMMALQVRRQSSQIFAGKHGFITPRDLFRWAERKPQTYQELAEHGFLLLGERCRKPTERQIVKDVIESATKTVLDEKSLYLPSHWPFVKQYYDQVENGAIDGFNIVWTESMQRLFTITGICLEHQEPVLLVGETGSSKTTVCQLWAALLDIPLHILNCHQHTEAADFLGSLRPVPPDRRDQALFEWKNGPLVQSMIDGDFFVLDEISLTEDSVLERLNSVLEPSRSVTLAEKSSADCITAHERFRVMATMNPGGDFGKKELSPALRNRFTEIYVRPTTDLNEVATILSRRLNAGLDQWASMMAKVLCGVAEATSSSGSPQHISIRDIISWVSFMNAAHHKCDEKLAFLHGLDAVLLDGIGVGTGQSEASSSVLKTTCEFHTHEIAQQCGDYKSQPFWTIYEGMDEPQLPPDMQTRFFFGAPATQRNLSKLMRASIVKKAVLLEGSPGVGKTSIVEALGCAMGCPVVRINLSEQTDIMDLFGTYLPSSDKSSTGPQFMWSDGVLLRALREGSWVILDELNLASQSVLEGLNALLDHRSAVFIPELNEEFRAHENFRIFACQNPLVEGGGRKGLPRSFLNRFIKVRVEAFEVSDLMCIIQAVFPDVEVDTLQRMVNYVGELQTATMVKRSFGVRGSPWEFNLRDVLRWASLMRRYNEHSNPTYFADMLFLQRMRSDSDLEQCKKLLEAHFGPLSLSSRSNSDFLVADGVVHFDGRQLYLRDNADTTPLSQPLLLLPSQSHLVQSLLCCAEQRQFALLIGPSGSGKSHVLRTAARLAGAKLVTFSMNASCDTVDLLGGFDQVEGEQGRFEWRDSLVLEAMLQGYWLVLDNANYCSASVLDRLNPLVEPNGVLSVNEQGLVDDAIRVIQPHPKFRLFATLNPRYGEISRAMRNRAVELFVAPVQIPSAESAVLCATSSTNGAEPNESVLWTVDKLGHYHQSFVSTAFHADTMAASSTLLSDSLAAGAPNVFTLLRTSAMLPVAQLGSLPHDSTSLANVILHRYITNRSGHWRIKKDQLVEALHALLSASSDLSRYPPLRETIAALQLTCGEDGVSDMEGLAALLARCRVSRSGLALKKMASLRGSETPALHDEADIALFFVLEQCMDSIPSEYVDVLRKQLLSESMSTEELSARAQSLIHADYSTMGLLPTLFCRAMQILGPQAHAVDFARRGSVQLTDSTLVCASVSEVLVSMSAFLSSLTDPSRFHDCLRLLAQFVEVVRQPVQVLTADTYVPLLAHATLLFEYVAQHDGAASFADVERALNAFVAAVQRYLSLPFPLLGGSSVLHDYVVQPHITSPEERASFAQWQLVTCEDDTAMPNLASNLQKNLLQHAAFRTEFALIQLVLRLNTPGRCTASMLHQLRDGIGIFLTHFTKTFPLFTEVEVALWTSLQRTISRTTPDAAAITEVVGQLTPLLVSRCATRYGLGSVKSIFLGAWTSSAHACLRYASQAHVLAVGRTQNEFIDTLRGLRSFLSVCPVVPRQLFGDWELNARQELKRILMGCFPATLQSQAFPDSSSSEMPRGSLAEAARSCIDELSCCPMVEAQRPLLMQVVQLLSAKKEENSRDNILQVIALLWSLKCRLLVPQSPIDPMYKRSCRRTISEDQLALLQRLESAFAYAEHLTMRAGCPQSAIIHELRSKEKELHAKAAHDYVPRPDPTGQKYAQLVRWMHQLCSTLLGDNRLHVVAVEARDGQTAAQAESWSELLFQQVVQMLDQYGGYEDITLNFAEPAFLACIAARASCHSAYGAEPTNTLFGHAQTLQLLQFPTTTLAGTSLPLPDPTNHASLLHRMKYLDSCLSILRSTLPHAISRDAVEGLFTTYRSLFRTVEELNAAEKQAEEMAVLYKEKAVAIEGDDEKLLRKMKALFPSYEKEFVLAAEATEEEEDQADDKKDADRAAKHARLMFMDGNYIPRLVETHQLFYQRLASYRVSSEAIHVPALMDAFRSRFDAIAPETNRLGEHVQSDGLGSSDEQLLLCGFSARAALLAKEMHGSTTTLAERNAVGFNIFADSDSHEVAQLSKPLDALLTTLQGLSERYPDAVSLQRCLRVGRKIAALPAMSTPLMKVMAGCELLLRECYEWERNASTEVSIMPHMTELSGFVLRWRRLELHCWSHVFKAKREEFGRAAALQWFALYDLIHDCLDQGPTVDAEEEGNRCLRVFHYVSQYMWSACFGDYSARLLQIRGFGYQLLLSEGRFAPLTNVLLHLTDFFAQFEPLIRAKCDAQIVPIEDDIAEFAKLMRWEDANYYAVRATAEKSHLKMARVLGSLEAVLRLPVLAAIVAEEERCEEDPSMGLSAWAVAAEGEADKKKQAKKQKAAAKKEEAKSPKGGKRKRGSNAAKPTDEVAPTPSASPFSDWTSCALQEGQEFMDDSTLQILQRITTLQQPKTANQLKVRALKTLFDTMNETGLAHTHEKQVGTWETHFASCEALLACRATREEVSASSDLDAAAEAHYAFARWVQRMREAQRKPHQDLSGAQVMRGTGLAENLFTDAVSMAQLLSALVELQHNLSAMRVCVEGAHSLAPPEHEDAEALHTSADLRLLDTCLSLSCSLRSLHGALEWMLQEGLTQDGAEGYRSILADLAHTTQHLFGLCQRQEYIRRCSSISTAPVGVSQRCMQALREAQHLCGRLRGVADHNVASAAALHEKQVEEALAAYTAGMSEVERSRKRSKAETMGNEDWLQRTRDHLHGIALSLTEDLIVSSSPTINHDAEDGETYRRYHDGVEQLQTLLATISATHQELLHAAASSPEVAALSLHDSQELLVLLTRATSLVGHVQHAVSSVSTSHSKLGVVMARLMAVLMKKGFCKTEDEEENDNDGDGDGGQQEGTGMDDGQGEKDVTDQLDNEDQLMNQKDLEQQEQQEEDKKQDEEDKAADVETDFQAEKENREDSHDDEDEDEGEDDDSQQEMGSVDEENEQDRKKTRKDKGDDNDMDEDEGEQAEEVPQDEFGDEDPLDEETGGFTNKEDAIREQEEEKKGEHELVGDEDDGAISDAASDSDDDEDGRSADKSDAEDREDDAEDEEQDRDEDLEKEEVESHKSEQREDDNQSTDMDHSTQDEREIDGEPNEEEDNSDADEFSGDERDQNVYDGGQQDHETGEEATENKKEKERNPQQQDATGADEEQQPGEEQKQDDAGRNFQKQQEENQQAQRRDNTEQNRSQHNPYRAVKEALQRHQQQRQQLNLNQRVEVDQDNKTERPQKEAPQQPQTEDVENFDFDEEGEHEGMAAVHDDEELQHKATEVEQQEEPSSADDAASSSAVSSDAEEESGADEPQDSRRRRGKNEEDVTDMKDASDAKPTKRNKEKVKLTAKTTEKEESEEEEEEEAAEKEAEVEEEDVLSRGRQLWVEQEAVVQGLSQQLCEQLRLILAPTLADKLQGDYKTGKRLNMKRIIPYIASQFKKDRIWLRRTKPNKRTYQIMVALDDSLSMQTNNAGVFSCQAVALIAKALQQLEVGEIGVASFGKEARIIHPLEEAFGADSGPRTFSEITFKQTSTNLKLFLESTLTYLDDARDRLNGQTRSTTQQLQQVLFVLSDGQITEDRAELRKLIARAETNHQMVVFVLLDIKAATEVEAAAPAQTAPLTPQDLKGLSTAERLRRLKADRDARLKRVQSNSILDMQLVEFKANKVIRRGYMEDFPFPYYLIVRELNTLPEIIADAMRQWFELMNVPQ